MIDRLYYFCLSLAVLAGLASFGQLGRANRYLLGLVGYGWLQDTANILVGAFGLETTLISHYSRPITVALGISALFEYAVMRRRRPWKWSLIGFYLLFWVSAALLGDLTQTFSNYAAPVQAALLSVGAAWLLTSATQAWHSQAAAEAPVLVGLAVLCIYSPFVVLWPLGNVLWPAHEELLQKIWSVRNLLMAVGYLVLAKALWWKPPPPLTPSSGSPASA